MPAFTVPPLSFPVPRKGTPVRSVSVVDDRRAAFIASVKEAQQHLLDQITSLEPADSSLRPCSSGYKRGLIQCVRQAEIEACQRHETTGSCKRPQEPRKGTPLPPKKFCSFLNQADPTYRDLVPPTSNAACSRPSVQLETSESIEWGLRSVLSFCDLRHVLQLLALNPTHPTLAFVLSHPSTAARLNRVSQPNYCQSVFSPFFDSATPPNTSPSAGLQQPSDAKQLAGCLEGYQTEVLEVVGLTVETPGLLQAVVEVSKLLSLSSSAAFDVVMALLSRRCTAGMSAIGHFLSESSGKGLLEGKHTTPPPTTTTSPMSVSQQEMGTIIHSDLLLALSWTHVSLHKEVLSIFIEETVAQLDCVALLAGVETSHIEQVLTKLLASDAAATSTARTASRTQRFYISSDIQADEAVRSQLREPIPRLAALGLVALKSTIDFDKIDTTLWSLRASFSALNVTAVASLIDRQQEVLATGAMDPSYPSVPSQRETESANSISELRVMLFHCCCQIETAIMATLTALFRFSQLTSLTADEAYRRVEFIVDRRFLGVYGHCIALKENRSIETSLGLSSVLLAAARELVLTDALYVVALHELHVSVPTLLTLTPKVRELHALLRNCGPWDPLEAFGVPNVEHMGMDLVSVAHALLCVRLSIQSESLPDTVFPHRPAETPATAMGDSFLAFAETILPSQCASLGMALNALTIRPNPSDPMHEESTDRGALPCSGLLWRFGSEAVNELHRRDKDALCATTTFEVECRVLSMSGALRHVLYDVIEATLVTVRLDELPQCSLYLHVVAELCQADDTITKRTFTSVKLPSSAGEVLSQSPSSDKTTFWSVVVERYLFPLLPYTLPILLELLTAFLPRPRPLGLSPREASDRQQRFVTLMTAVCQPMESLCFPPLSDAVLPWSSADAALEEGRGSSTDALSQAGDDTGDMVSPGHPGEGQWNCDTYVTARPFTIGDVLSAIFNLPLLLPHQSPAETHDFVLDEGHVGHVIRMPYEALAWELTLCEPLRCNPPEGPLLVVDPPFGECQPRGRRRYAGSVWAVGALTTASDTPQSVYMPIDLEELERFDRDCDAEDAAEQQNMGSTARGGPISTRFGNHPPTESARLIPNPFRQSNDAEQRVRSEAYQAAALSLGAQAPYTIRWVLNPCQNGHCSAPSFLSMCVDLWKQLLLKLERRCGRSGSRHEDSCGSTVSPELQLLYRVVDFITQLLAFHPSVQPLLCRFLGSLPDAMGFSPSTIVVWFIHTLAVATRLTLTSPVRHVCGASLRLLFTSTFSGLTRLTEPLPLTDIKTAISMELSPDLFVAICESAERTAQSHDASDQRRATLTPLGPAPECLHAFWLVKLLLTGAPSKRQLHGRDVVDIPLTDVAEALRELCHSSRLRRASMRLMLEVTEFFTCLLRPDISPLHRWSWSCLGEALYVSQMTRRSVRCLVRQQPQMLGPWNVVERYVMQADNELSQLLLETVLPGIVAGTHGRFTTMRSLLGKETIGTTSVPTVLRIVFEILWQQATSSQSTWTVVERALLLSRVIPLITSVVSCFEVFNSQRIDMKVFRQASIHGHDDDDVMILSPEVTCDEDLSACVRRLRTIQNDVLNSLAENDVPAVLLGLLFADGSLSAVAGRNKATTTERPTVVQIVQNPLLSQIYFIELLHCHAAFRNLLQSLEISRCRPPCRLTDLGGSVLSSSAQLLSSLVSSALLRASTGESPWGIRPEATSNLFSKLAVSLRQLLYEGSANVTRTGSSRVTASTTLRQTLLSSCESSSMSLYSQDLAETLLQKFSLDLTFENFQVPWKFELSLAMSLIAGYTTWGTALGKAAAVDLLVLLRLLFELDSSVGHDVIGTAASSDAQIVGQLQCRFPSEFLHHVYKCLTPSHDRDDKADMDAGKDVSSPILGGMIQRLEHSFIVHHIKQLIVASLKEAELSKLTFMRLPTHVHRSVRLLTSLLHRLPQYAETTLGCLLVLIVRSGHVTLLETPGKLESAEGFLRELFGVLTFWTLHVQCQLETFADASRHSSTTFLGTPRQLTVSDLHVLRDVLGVIDSLILSPLGRLTLRLMDEPCVLLLNNALSVTVVPAPGGQDGEKDAQGSPFVHGLQQSRSSLWSLLERLVDPLLRLWKTLEERRYEQLPSKMPPTSLQFAEDEIRYPGFIGPDSGFRGVGDDGLDAEMSVLGTDDVSFATLIALIESFGLLINLTTTAFTKHGLRRRRQNTQGESAASATGTSQSLLSRFPAGAEENKTEQTAADRSSGASSEGSEGLTGLYRTLTCSPHVAASLLEPCKRPETHTTNLSNEFVPRARLLPSRLTTSLLAEWDTTCSRRRLTGFLPYTRCGLCSARRDRCHVFFDCNLANGCHRPKTATRLLWSSLHLLSGGGLPLEQLPTSNTDDVPDIRWLLETTLESPEALFNRRTAFEVCLLDYVREAFRLMTDHHALREAGNDTTLSTQELAMYLERLATEAYTAVELSCLVSTEVAVGRLKLMVLRSLARLLRRSRSFCVFPNIFPPSVDTGGADVLLKPFTPFVVPAVQLLSVVLHERQDLFGGSWNIEACPSPRDPPHRCVSFAASLIEFLTALVTSNWECDVRASCISNFHKRKPKAGATAVSQLPSQEETHVSTCFGRAHACLLQKERDDSVAIEHLPRVRLCRMTGGTNSTDDPPPLGGCLSALWQLDTLVRPAVRHPPGAWLMYPLCERIPCIPSLDILEVFGVRCEETGEGHATFTYTQTSAMASGATCDQSRQGPEAILMLSRLVMELWKLCSATLESLLTGSCSEQTSARTTHEFWGAMELLHVTLRVWGFLACLGEPLVDPSTGAASASATSHVATLRSELLVSMINFLPRLLTDDIITNRIAAIDSVQLIRFLDTSDQRLRGDTTLSNPVLPLNLGETLVLSSASLLLCSVASALIETTAATAVLPLTPCPSAPCAAGGTSPKKQKENQPPCKWDLTSPSLSVSVDARPAVSQTFSENVLVAMTTALKALARPQALINPFCLQGGGDRGRVGHVPLAFGSTSFVLPRSVWVASFDISTAAHTVITLGLLSLLTTVTTWATRAETAVLDAHGVPNLLMQLPQSRLFMRPLRLASQTVHDSSTAPDDLEYWRPAYERRLPTQTASELMTTSPSPTRSKSHTAWCRSLVLFTKLHDVEQHNPGPVTSNEIGMKMSSHSALVNLVVASRLRFHFIMTTLKLTGHLAHLEEACAFSRVLASLPPLQAIEQHSARVTVMVMLLTGFKAIREIAQLSLGRGQIEMAEIFKPVSEREVRAADLDTTSSVGGGRAANVPSLFHQLTVVLILRTLWNLLQALRRLALECLPLNELGRLAISVLDDVAGRAAPPQSSSHDLALSDLLDDVFHDVVDFGRLILQLLEDLPKLQRRVFVAVYTAHGDILLPLSLSVTCHDRIKPLPEVIRAVSGMMSCGSSGDVGSRGRTRSSCVEPYSPHFVDTPPPTPRVSSLATPRSPQATPWDVSTIISKRSSPLVQRYAQGAFSQAVGQPLDCPLQLLSRLGRLDAGLATDLDMTANGLLPYVWRVTIAQPARDFREVMTFNALLDMLQQSVEQSLVLSFKLFNRLAEEAHGGGDGFRRPAVVRRLTEFLAAVHSTPVERLRARSALVKRMASLVSLKLGDDPKACCVLGGAATAADHRRQSTSSRH